MKLFDSKCMELLSTVAPHAGAWIETSLNLVKILSFMSLLTQERGLKLNKVALIKLL